jgi:hypothetical protein
MKNVGCIVITGLVLLGSAFSHAQDDMGDSIQVEELLVMDTLALDIKGPSNDVAFYMNGLVFLSNPKFHKEMIPDHIAFGKITSFFVPMEYIALESSRQLFENDPFPYSPGGTCYTRDYGTVYFTKRTDIPGNQSPEKIFEMEIIQGKATTYRQLPFTAGPTRFMHPAIAANNDFMIMASDLNPSFGGLDLFITRKGVSGWLTPVNLGPDINTSGHEWYPFLDQHNNLYFSSSGHMGFGGYDLYVCFFDGQGWGEPQNLTRLVNSEKDEIGFSVHPGRQMAIFSTQTEEMEQVEEVLKLKLNNSAFILAGIDSKNQDISLLLKDLITTGFTDATYGAASDLEVQAGFSLTALPLLTEEEPEEEVPEPEPVAEVDEPEPVVEQTEPEPELIVEEPVEAETTVAPVLVLTEPEEEV